MNILLHRTGAFGDVLLTTPVAARLRKENPDAKIYVSTQHTNAYYHNPHVDHIGYGLPPSRLDRTINLDLAYESRPDVHPLAAYMSVAFDDLGDGHDKTVVYVKGELPAGLGAWEEFSRTIVVHPNVSWPNRTLPVEFWGELVRKLRLLGEGYRVISLGTQIDHDLAPYGAIDTRGMLSTPDQAAVIDASACFVAFASGLGVLAGATETPIVWLNTISSWKSSAMYRRDELAWNVTPIDTPLSCRGCHDRRAGPITYMDCPLGHADCVRSFDPRVVAQAAMDAIIRDRRRDP